jgi:hypothetical protein
MTNTRILIEFVLDVASAVRCSNSVRSAAIQAAANYTLCVPFPFKQIQKLHG